MSNWLRVLVLMIAAAPAEVVAAAEVAVRGRIVDASGRAGFEGAIVRIEPLAPSQSPLETVTGRDGTFRFAAVSAGDYVLRVEYVGAPTLRRDIRVPSDGMDLGDVAIGASVTMLDNVLVVGQLASLAAADSRKRAADNIVDIVSADAIGQFPDQNAAEALQRLPGISIVSEQGEGRFVSVRGMSPNLNSVSIGGARLPSDEDDARQVALDLIPSELLQSLEVAKTSTPDEDADGIGASIDIETTTAFDRPAASANATVQGSHNAFTQAWNPKLSTSATRVFDAGKGTRNLGVALSATWSRRKFGWESIDNENGWPIAEESAEHFRSPESIDQRDSEHDLERRGFAFNLDYRPGADAELYLHTLQTNVGDNQVQQLDRYRFDEGDVIALTENSGTSADARLDKSVTFKREVRSLSSVVGGYSNSIGPWTFDIDSAWSQARTRESDDFEASFHADTDLAYAGTGPTPFLTPASAAGFDPSAFTLDEILLERENASDRETHVGLDARRELDFGDWPGFIKFGGKSRRREKSSDIDIATFDEFGRDVSLSEFATTIAYGLGPFGPAIGVYPLRRFFDDGHTLFAINEEETFIASRGRDYRIEEDVDAGYAMGGADIGALRWVGGVRVERTDLQAAGTRIIIGTTADGIPLLAPVVASKSYTDAFPSLHLRYELSPTWLARLALTQSIARPSFSFLAPAQRIDIEQGEDGVVRRAEIGNPELDPYRSDNFDVSAEYYGDKAVDVFAASAFYKRIDNPIVLADIAGTGAYADFERVIAPINGDSARLAGIELNYTHRYVSLPAPWDGLLTAVNLSLTDSDARLDSSHRRLPLPDQSDTVSNLVVGYEKGMLSLRVAGNYRSERLLRLDQPEDPAFDVYEAGHFSLDLSAKFRLGDHWRVYFDAINVTNRPLYEYYGDNDFVARYETYGRTFQLGLRGEL